MTSIAIDETVLPPPPMLTVSICLKVSMDLMHGFFDSRKHWALLLFLLGAPVPPPRLSCLRSCESSNICLPSRDGDGTTFDVMDSAKYGRLATSRQVPEVDSPVEVGVEAQEEFVLGDFSRGLREPAPPTLSTQKPAAWPHTRQKDSHTMADLCSMRQILLLSLIGTAVCFAPTSSFGVSTRHLHQIQSLSPSVLTQRRPLARQHASRSSHTQIQMGLRSSASLAIANVAVKVFQSKSLAVTCLSVGIALLGFVYYLLSVPSRAYKDGEGTVGKEYDAWTEEGILEYYWVRSCLCMGLLRYSIFARNF
jgi:hypothetical protein